jgi:phosphoribosylaminoimidazole-succinocarboxamide synthase
MSQLPAKWAPKEKRKQSLDFRSERKMRLLNATSVTLFNNLNQAICVGTHSIEHQKQFLISMSDEVTKATLSCSS